MGSGESKNFGSIAQQSRLDHADLTLLLKQFNAISKNGEIKKEDLKRIIEKKYGSDSSLTAILYNLFDRDGDKTINFTEFALAYGFLVNKTLDDVVDTSFHCMDLNGDGNISKGELRAVVMMNKKMEKYIQNDKKVPLDKLTLLPIEVSKINQEADDLFLQLDVNKDGGVSKQEFIQLASSSPELKKKLTSYLVRDEALDFFNTTK
ncbi:hypothetical protein ACTFIV_007496 [Dictyostelium citrinum]